VTIKPIKVIFTEPTKKGLRTGREKKKKKIKEGNGTSRIVIWQYSYVAWKEIKWKRRGKKEMKEKGENRKRDIICTSRNVIWACLMWDTEAVIHSHRVIGVA
jgi:hypothetical protein